MKLFSCPCCAQILHFENTACGRCGRRTGYMPETDLMTALEPADDLPGTWRVKAESSRSYRFCENAQHDVCNWLIPAADEAVFCLACRHNRQVPNLSEPTAQGKWQQIEAAKHRLIYTLRHLGLPIPAPGEVPEPLVFDFLADEADPGAPKVMTGHENGLITIALAEADDSERESRRAAMGEPYRTLIGHFRHEVGHYYWDRLVRDAGRLDACRAVFGDDSQDYQAALQRHYDEGPPPDWAEHYVSSYATTHPWEDFAETWAHYLHIVDSLEMARALGLAVAPRLDQAGILAARPEVDPYAEDDMGRLVQTWVPVAFAMNAVNRCMGQRDLYPFVLPPAVIGKLAFIRELINASRGPSELIDSVK
ncbi:zinc-binding metallopeptidase family protein [Enterovirga rhinocerotis]|uniref:Zinc-ribbon domain-containing protein n=1 Tax=Enterovirga rhinocerotis TaxID=1339210 RepID=A0A4R7C9F6_9HYPH|nr:putative zinc-binding peptidase [Enterovirga rhinocerotis]TDR93377.1 hypothetical protein EV668_0638 [Enterovirga rhinocerotis]